MDHILAAKIEDGLELNVNSEEAQDLKRVTLKELVAGMEADPELFTPWFRLIVKKYFINERWWSCINQDDWSFAKEATKTTSQCVS